MGGLRGKIELQALRIAQKANQLTPDEKKILYNMLEGDIKYPVGVKALDTYFGEPNLDKQTEEKLESEDIDVSVAPAAMQSTIKRIRAIEEQQKGRPQAIMDLVDEY